MTKSKFDYNDIKDENLIELVRANRIIYNKNETGSNPERKLAAWRKIAAQLGDTEERCQSRWKTLRERYARELKKMNAAEEMGATGVDKWQLYDYMDFLREYVKPRGARGIRSKIYREIKGEVRGEVKAENFDVSYDMDPLSPQGDISESSPCQVEIETPILPPKTKKRRRNSDMLEEILLDALSAHKNLCETRSEKYTDCIRTFGDMVMANLAEMDNIQQAQAMKSISDILMTMRMGVEIDHNYTM